MQAGALGAGRWQGLVLEVTFCGCAVSVPAAAGERPSWILPRWKRPGWRNLEAQRLFRSLQPRSELVQGHCNPHPVPGTMGGLASPSAQLTEHSLALPLSPAQGDMTPQLPEAEAPTRSLPKEAPTPPKAGAGVLGVPKDRLLLPLPTAAGTGVLCPKAGAGAAGNEQGT